jgi:hypothetical protein
MNANVQKLWNQLRPSEQKRIKEALTQDYYDRLDETYCDMQINWLKLACCNNHNMGMSVEEQLEWLGGWKGLYRTNSRFQTQQELTDFLNVRMDEIFGEGGFPEEFVQAFRKIGR